MKNHNSSLFIILFQYIIRGKMAPIRFDATKSTKKIDVIDDIAIMLTLVKLHSGHYYSQQHELNTNKARLWVSL